VPVSIQVIGSGTWVPRKHRSSACIAATIHDERILFDCGTGTIRRIAECDIDYRSIKKIFFTHTHIDHTADLAPLLFAVKHSPDLPEDYSLTLYGPSGYSEFVTRLRAAYQPTLDDFNFQFHVQDLTHQVLHMNGWNVTSIPMCHGIPAVGYRVKYQSRCFAITGDTDYCPSVIELCRDADIAFVECSTPDNQKIQGHLTPSLAAQIAAKAQCKKLVLTHFYPPCDEIDVVTQCQKIYNGKVIAAEDLMLFNV